MQFRLRHRIRIRHRASSCHGVHSCSQVVECACDRVSSRGMHALVSGAARARHRETPNTCVTLALAQTPNPSPNRPGLASRDIACRAAEACSLGIATRVLALEAEAAPSGGSPYGLRLGLGFPSGSGPGVRGNCKGRVISVLYAGGIPIPVRVRVILGLELGLGSGLGLGAEVGARVRGSLLCSGGIPAKAAALRMGSMLARAEVLSSHQSWVRFRSTGGTVGSAITTVKALYGNTQCLGSGSGLG